MDGAPDDLVEQVVANFAAELPDIDSDALRAACRIIIAGRVLEQHAVAFLKPSGLNYTDFDILGMLRSAGAPYELQPSDLLQSVMITSGAMTAAIGRLEQAGYVTRRVVSNDRRGRKISLTRAGKTVIEAALKRRYDDIAAAVKDVSERDKAALNRALSRITENLARATDQH